MNGWKLEFYDVAVGGELGSVTFDGSRMTTEGVATDLVEGQSADEVLAEFNGWSNGYVSARLAGDKRTIPQGGTRIHTEVEHDRAFTDFLETTHYVDPDSGEPYEPAGVPADPTPGDE
jgi:hypothetical protein